MDAAAKLLKAPRAEGRACLVCVTAAGQQLGMDAACCTLVQRIQGPGVKVREVDFSSASEGTCDLFGWQQPGMPELEQQNLADGSRPQQQQPTIPAAASQILILKNLCSLLHHLSAAEVIHFVNALSSISALRSIFVTLHFGKHSSILQCQLKLLASGWCELQPPDTLASTSGAQGTWVTTTCRRTGRLERSLDSFSLLEDGSLLVLVPKPRATIPHRTGIQPGMPVQAAQLPSTSRAGLEEAVERARQGVILPHEQLRKLGLARPVFGEGAAPLAVAQKPGPIGSIHYVRDSDSDHDSDEDPDDDLDM